MKNYLIIIIIICNNISFGKVSDSIHTTQDDYVYRINPLLPEFKFSFYLMNDAADKIVGISRIEIRRLDRGSLLQVIKTQEIAYHKDYKEGYIFLCKDMNFDGYLDILLSTSDDSEGCNKFKVWLYDVQSGKYVIAPQFEDLLNPIPHPETKTIASYFWGRKSNTEITYKFENNKLVPIRKEEYKYERSIKSDINTITLYDNEKILSVTIDTSLGISEYFERNPDIKDSVESILKTEFDSLVPISRVPINYMRGDEIAFRFKPWISFGHYEYSFIFEKDRKQITVFIFEVDSPIEYQLTRIFQRDPKISKAEALSRIKIRKRELLSEAHPELDTLWNSFFKVKFLIPRLEEGAIYLDPPTYEISVHNESIDANLKFHSSGIPVIRWATNIRNLLDCIE